MTTSTYPVRVDASLDPQLSRWLWLVKWLLAIPHYVVLAFLWLAFAVLSVVAFFAILFTGRYPRSIFDFNVGVLRWSWRVTYYAYGALGTDRYPPFSLADVPDYPAHLSVTYPEHLSRGLVLVKWWLLAIPHYLVVAVFLGGGWYAANGWADTGPSPLLSGGLIGLLVLVAAVVLLFTGRYPKGVFDFVLGMNRWVLRVAAYVGLMTDVYPPFRFDMGGPEPQTTDVALPPTAPGTGTGGADAAVSPREHAGPPATAPSHWTAGRVTAAVAGSLVFVMAGGLISGGVAVAMADHVLRDDQGFVMTGEQALSADGYALASEPMNLYADDSVGIVPEDFLGTAKVQVTAHTEQPVFVGVAAADDADAYLKGVHHSTVVDLTGGWDELTPVYQDESGTAPVTRPGGSDIWVAEVSGVGEQIITWPLESGEWTVVVMNADGSRAVTADVAVGASIPAADWIVAGLLVLGGCLLLVALALIAGSLHAVGKEGEESP